MENDKSAASCSLETKKEKSIVLSLVTTFQVYLLGSKDSQGEFPPQEQPKNYYQCDIQFC